jgi:hypothetical protein
LRLPWGLLERVAEKFLVSEFSVLGCLSFESRCTALPVFARHSSRFSSSIALIRISDPPDGFPDYRPELARRTQENRDRLRARGVEHTVLDSELQATEDELLDLVGEVKTSLVSDTWVLDITSLPKRFFCFFLKRLLRDPAIKNLVVTYTRAGDGGYTGEHLAADPMSCDHLPGFSAKIVEKPELLVISVGFELLNLTSLLEIYRDHQTPKIIFSFPPNGSMFRREWRTVYQMVAGRSDNISRDDTEIVATWDAEYVFRVLEKWNKDAEGLALGPFGAKPHSLAMALFAVKNDAALYYSQPKSYHPDYSLGESDTWAYVLKWSGVCCYDRSEDPI